MTKLELICPPMAEAAATSGAANDGAIIRCPSLQMLKCYNNQLTILELNCRSLLHLSCCTNQLTHLDLNCPSLRTLWCRDNQLARLNLNCPSLKLLWCHNNQLTDLNGLEFCADLKELHCSPALRESVEVLKTHLPDLFVNELTG